jgi:hypothetical protein
VSPIKSTRSTSAPSTPCLDALEAHGKETGCEVSAFIVPYERADCVCAACGTIVYEGPAFEPEA